MDQFAGCLEEAIKAGVPEPHAMTLSTVDAGGPDARVLLLKDVDENGWYFAANSASPKGRRMTRNAEVALSFYWPTVGRQVWQGSADRRHVRLRYHRGQSKWSSALLWP